MRKYRVDVTETAKESITEIFEYISLDNKDAAISWLAEIERQIDSLEKFPLRCAVIPEANELGKEYHHIINSNYRTIFKIAGKKVIILRIIHSSQLFNLQVLE